MTCSWPKSYSQLPYEDLIKQGMQLPGTVPSTHQEVDKCLLGTVKVLVRKVIRLRVVG